MRYLLAPFLAAALLFTREAGTTDALQPPIVSNIVGKLFDEMTGELSKDDVFDRSYMPRNRLDTGLFLVLTLNLGERCIVPQLTPQEAGAVAKGERPPPTRPASCTRPPGKIMIEAKHGTGTRERRELALSMFSSGEDGKLHVPVMFYRTAPCLPLDITVKVSGQLAATRSVAFSCGE